MSKTGTVFNQVQKLFHKQRDRVLPRVNIFWDKSAAVTLIIAAYGYSARPYINFFFNQNSVSQRPANGFLSIHHDERANAPGWWTVKSHEDAWQPQHIYHPHPHTMPLQPPCTLHTSGHYTRADILHVFGAHCWFYVYGCVGTDGIF